MMKTHCINVYIVSTYSFMYPIFLCNKFQISIFNLQVIKYKCIRIKIRFEYKHGNLTIGIKERF